MAALLALGVGATLWSTARFLPLSWGQNVDIEAVDGGLFQVADAGYLPLTVGREIPYGAVVRSGKDSTAVVRLADGSQVEMSERAELRVVRQLRGTTIQLARGEIIVEAAKQRHGHLFVRTDDCEVAVKGTIFAVNHGTKGSRVSVVEGAVLVDHGPDETLLHPGDQLTTHASLGPVPVEQEIAWSRNVDDYLALMGELNALRKDVAEAIGSSDLRHSSTLLDLAPASTTFYAAMPNLTGSATQIRQLVEERLATSPLLQQWWQQQGQALANPELLNALDRVTSFGEFLGDEIVLTLGVEPHQMHHQAPHLLLLASTDDEAGLRDFLTQQLAELQAGEHLVLVDDLATLPSGTPPDETLYLWVGQGLLAASPEPALLQELYAHASGTANPFAGSPFYTRLTAAYADGVDWLAGVDMGEILHRALSDEPDSHTGTVLAQAGILDARYLILERNQSPDHHVHHRAELTFAGPRQGLAAWLAPPAPMASLDFVSADATLVTAFLIKDPALLVQEIFSLADLSGGDFRRQLDEFEAQHGISVVDDFAAPLGGEFTFALDGPVLPTPAWKLIVEVYDAARLQNTISWLVDQMNQHSSMEVSLTPEDIGGHPAFRLSSPILELHYAFTDGYLLLGPSRAVIEATLRQPSSGYGLTSSPTFMALLPQDGHVNFSGLTFQRMDNLLGALSRQFGNLAGGTLTPEQQQQLDDLLADIPASLACAYGEEDRITFVSDSEDDLLGGLLGLGSAFGLKDLLQQASKWQQAIPPAAANAPATV